MLIFNLQLISPLDHSIIYLFLIYEQYSDCALNFFETFNKN
jgi:hypothetical protein